MTKDMLETNFNIKNLYGKWMYMLTRDYSLIADHYNGNKKILLSTHTYEEVKNTIDTIMKLNCVTDYQINTSLQRGLIKNTYIAVFFVTYIQNNKVESFEFQIQNDF